MELKSSQKLEPSDNSFLHNLEIHHDFIDNAFSLIFERILKVWHSFDYSMCKIIRSFIQTVCSLAKPKVSGKQLIFQKKSRQFFYMIKK